MRSSIRLLLLVVFFATGCATQKPLLQKHHAQPVEPRFSGDVWQAAPDRGLNPGDQLRVALPLNKELNATATVQPDGSVDLPGIGTIRVGGLTVAQVRHKLVEEYRRIVREPEVTVDVVRQEQPVVYVGGEVGRPGTVRFVNGMTVVAAIFQAGGPRPSAKLSNVILLRESAPNQAEVMSLDLRAVLRGDQEYVNPVLKPYDVVIVPASKIAKLDQFVDHYIDGLLPLATITGFAWVYRIVVQGY